MSVYLYADQTRVSVYEEAPGGGSQTDINSAMNRPVLSPLNWLSNVYFHSDFNYYNTFTYDMARTITHGGVAGSSTYVTLQTKYEGLIVQSDHLLLTHNLGYVPRFFVATAGRMLPHGYPVQNVDLGRIRFVTAYATATELRLFELASSSALDLPAVNVTYQAIVFADSVADPLLKKLLIQPGNVVFGQGKFRLDRPPLRAVAGGESPFVVATGRTAAIGNGALRVYQPNGSPIDFGSFAGSLPAPSYINVQLGV